MVDVGDNGDITDVLVHGTDGFWRVKKGKKVRTGPADCKAEAGSEVWDLRAVADRGWLMRMAQVPETTEKPAGRRVIAETLAVAPEVLNLPLAEPWRRLAAIAVDVTVVALLSLLATPILGLATGALVMVLLGSRREVPVAMKAVRWILRGFGAVIVLLSVLALGHVSSVQSRALNLDVLTGRTESAALKETVFVSPNPSAAELRAANARLQQQVEDLKKEFREQQAAGSSLLYRAKAFTGALGVTFGWSGIYFTLIVGAWNGRSLGKFLFRVRVVKINGQPLTFFDAFVRQGGYIAGVAMGMIGFLKILWDPNRQTVEDRIAATVVVKG